MANDSLAHQAAAAIHRAFLEYEARFTAITRRARQRFEGREWRKAQDDAVERLTLYKTVVNDTVAVLLELLEANVRNAFVWREIKAVHGRVSQGRLDSELSGTFFNSITRRIFTTVGVDPNIEYLDFIREPDDRGEGVQPGLWSFKAGRPTADIVIDILSSLPFRPEHQDLSRDAALAAQAIDRELTGHPGTLEAIEILPPVFYRGTAAYVVGRMRVSEALLPLVFAFLHPEEGIVTDAVLMRPNEVSIVFSFTRSYFHVDVDRPHLTISVLRSIMPRKPV
ncbi:MAG: isocitrate dehydrogenase kinase/phosphatase AceK regulatory subunit, partial [Gemmatimonadota bacterium]